MNLDAGGIQTDHVYLDFAGLVGSLASPNSFGPVLRYMAEGKLKVKPLITHVRPLEELESVVKMVRAKKEMRIKILLKP